MCCPIFDRKSSGVFRRRRAPQEAQSKKEIIMWTFISLNNFYLKLEGAGPVDNRPTND